MADADELLRRARAGEPVPESEIAALPEPEALHVHGWTLVHAGRAVDGVHQMAAACEAGGFHRRGPVHDLEQLLDRAGEHRARAEVLFRYALARADRRHGGRFDPEVLEALSFTWSLDFRKLNLHFAHQRDFAWQVGRVVRDVARRRPWERPGGPPPAGDGRIGIVVPNLVDLSNSPTKLLMTLCRFLPDHGRPVSVYATEVLVGREKPNFWMQHSSTSSRSRGARTLTALESRDIPTWLGRADRDHVQNADDLAARMADDGVVAALYMGSLATTIMAAAAARRAVPLQVNINIGCPMFAPDVPHVTYGMRRHFDEHRAGWEGTGVTPHYVDDVGMWLDDDLHMSTPSRADLGVPDDAPLYLTVGNHLPSRLSDAFLDCVARILRDVPGAHWLAIGPGDFGPVAARLKEMGVGDRCRFPGGSQVAAAHNRLADVYLNEFPEGGGASVLEAMAAGNPVAAMAVGTDFLMVAGPNYLGDRAIWKNDPDEYVRRATAWGRDPDLRAEEGAALRRRYETHFNGERFAGNLSALVEELLPAAMKDFAPGA